MIKYHVVSGKLHDSFPDSTWYFFVLSVIILISYISRETELADTDKRLTFFDSLTGLPEWELFRSGFAVYKDATAHSSLAGMLKAGLKKEEFTLYYQPEYNLDTNEVNGVEALTRWFHPAIGYIAPQRFITAAEESGQIYDLEYWIVRKALDQKLQWEREGLGHIELSINLSSKTLESESAFNRLEELISSYNINYSKVIMEITETVIISNLEVATERLDRLRRTGIRIALDDFGTGYSSLLHLIKLPVDIIKIDRSFIRELPGSNEGTIVVKNILTLAHEMKYKVVAEGIETQEQLEYLRENYCECGQGFLLCIPLPPEKLNNIL